jgi:hypothetical protein
MTGRQRARCVLILVTVLLWASAAWVGAQKNLVGTLTEQEWGRHLFGIGGALTHLKFGIGGYVVDHPIQEKLLSEGLTANSAILKRLGAKYPDNLHDERLLQTALDRAYAYDVPAPPRGDYQRLRGSAGDDVGIATFTELSFRLFGLRLAALYEMYFVLLALEIALFFVGHYRSPAALMLVALAALAIYLLVVSDLVNVARLPIEDSGAVDIKDPRFFGTLAIIPALHFLTILIPREVTRSVSYAALAGQSVLFALALHIRWPSIWLVLGLATYWLAITVHRRQWRPLIAGLIFFPTIVAGMIATTMAAHPLYKLDGDLLHHPFWHHLMTAQQANPRWATKYLATVNNVSGDDMPAEIARQEIAKLPPDQHPKYLMRNNYPNPQAIATFARKRFLAMVENDPWFVVETFLVIPRRDIAGAISDFYKEFIEVATIGRLSVALAVFAVIVLAVGKESMGLPSRMAGVCIAFALLALAPNLIAMPAHQVVMVDHFLWSILATCLVASLAAVYVTRAFRFGHTAPLPDDSSD